MKASDKFPDDFFWGASTASHQIEGGTYNQWSVWELANALELSKSAEANHGWLKNWDRIKDRATDPNNYVSGTGIEHYSRYEQDFDIAKKLNLNAFRFSIEWSRIEPEEGKWDEAEIEHYRQYIRALKQRGLEPFLNLWHWTNPVWFEERGGFMRRSNLGYFLRFAATVIEELGDDLNYVLVLNEPNIYAWYSFGEGRWPAPKTSRLAFMYVYLNLITAHRKAYKLLKDIKPALQISSAPQLVYNAPLDAANRWHRFGAWLANWANNGLWLGLTSKHSDFIGFNNYFKNYAAGLGPGKFKNPKTPVNDLGWYMEPGAVGEMAVAIHKKYPGKPIIITENGVADETDEHRQWWLEETILAITKAKRQGADIRGYFHWSLLDNFEWAEGWWPKFGLVAVDREKNMKRTVRKSALWFAGELKRLRGL